MPTYNLSCKKEGCGKVFEAYLPRYTTPNPPCQECGEETERIWSLGSQHVGSSVFPYVTTHLNGKPIEVTSASHLEALCKEYGVTHRPDAAWVDKEYLGYDPFKKKQMYREGSGMGMPGSWV